jgi:23S rRNA (pseudouridine1915-N3)-methyltransferase
MKLAFAFVGGHKEAWLVELAEEYSNKLSFFCPTEVIRIRPSRQARASAGQKLAEETQGLLRVVKKDDILVVCDENGEAVSSRKLSGKMVKLFERGRPRVVFLVGGAFGFGHEVKARADWIWSLSPLTLNHHIAQALVLEQTYRAFAIWKNLPYHND